MRLYRIFALVLCVFFSTQAGPAKADPMETVYLVASDANMEMADILVSYLENSGTKFVQVKPENLDSVKEYPYFVVIGSPKDQDNISAFAKEMLSPKQWADAQEMGKAGAVIVKTDKNEVLFFFSDYSLKTLITGSKDRWTENFSDWYNIPLSITQIIGY